MTDDDEAMYARPTGTRMERATEIMSRAHCMRDDQGETEEQIEARHAGDKRKMELHDHIFGHDLIDVGGAVPLTRRLARSLGFDVEPADNGHGDMGDSGNPDRSPRPVLDYGGDE